MEELITYETAKLAKEKGFKWKFNTLDNYKLGQYSYFERHDNKTNVIAISHYEYDTTNCSAWKNGIAAPTQSLLQRWLREEHNIHINIYWDEEFYSFEFYTSECGISNMKYEDLKMSYEKCLEFALLEALKLIE